MITVRTPPNSTIIFTRSKGFSRLCICCDPFCFFFAVEISFLAWSLLQPLQSVLQLSLVQKESLAFVYVVALFAFPLQWRSNFWHDHCYNPFNQYYNFHSFKRRSRLWIYRQRREVYIGLARTIYIRCLYCIFGREITNYTVIYRHINMYGSGQLFICCDPIDPFLFSFAVEEFYGTWYQSGSFPLVNMGSGFQCPRSSSFSFPYVLLQCYNIAMLLFKNWSQVLHTELSSFTVPETKVAHFPSLMRGVIFTATCVYFCFLWRFNVMSAI